MNVFQLGNLYQTKFDTELICELSKNLFISENFENVIITNKKLKFQI